jgi:hypothetical protein
LEKQAGIVPVLMVGRDAKKIVTHPMKQAHGVKNVRRRFIVADLRFIK